MKISHDLNEIITTLGLPVLDFDMHGCARLLFNESVVVNFEYDEVSSLLHLYTDLGSPPSNRQEHESLYRSLLEANLFGVETSGATIALDRNHNQIVLYKTIHYSSLTLSSFSQLLSGFVDCATRWHQLLMQAAGQAESGGDTLEAGNSSPRSSGLAPFAPKTLLAIRT